MKLGLLPTLSFIAVLAMIVTTGLSFGLLINTGSVGVSVASSSGELTGAYATALLCMAAFTIALVLVMFGFWLYKLSAGCSMSGYEKAVRMIFGFTMIIGFVGLVMDVALVSNFNALLSNGNIVYDPASPAPGDPYSLKGSFAIGLLVVNSLTIAGLGICLIAMSVLWARPKWMPEWVWVKETVKEDAAGDIQVTDTYMDQAGDVAKVKTDIGRTSRGRASRYIVR